MEVVKKLSGLLGTNTGDRFLMKCPETGIVHVLRKYRSSATQNHYMSTQGYGKGRMALLRAFMPTGRKHHLTRSDLCKEGIKYALSYR